MKLSLRHRKDLNWALRHSVGVKELWIHPQVVHDVGLGALERALRQFPELELLRIERGDLRENALRRFASSHRESTPRVELRFHPPLPKGSA